MRDCVIRLERKVDYRQAENLVREAFDRLFPPKEKLKLPGQLFD